jgi:hypothetical protein
MITIRSLKIPEKLQMSFKCLISNILLVASRLIFLMLHDLIFAVLKDIASRIYSFIIIGTNQKFYPLSF